MSLDDIIANTQDARIVGEEHDLSKINWVRGLSDPGEMLACGYLPQARRQEGETDEAYAKRLVVVLAPHPELIEKIKAAALHRAGLDTTGGRVNMFAAGELPWHGLGVNVARAVNSRQAIELAGLNWEVVKTKLSYQFGGESREAKDVFGIVRQDTGHMLGAVGNRYRPIQNAEGFAFLDGVLQEFGARFESAGSLYKGEKVWMLAHLPKQAFTVNGGDAIAPYVIFTNNHDGSAAANCYPTSVRVVCQNTFRVSGQDKGKGLSIRHSGDVKSKIKAARAALGMAVEEFQGFREGAEQMHKKPCNINHYANDVLDAVLEVTQADALKGADALAAVLKVTEAERELAAKSFERKIERRGEILTDILERYHSERCNFGNIGGTMWAGFNAVTEHADHAKPARSNPDLDVRRSQRFESTLDGTADALKQSAYQIALAV